MKSYFFGVFAACENASFCLCFEDLETAKKRVFDWENNDFLASWVVDDGGGGENVVT